MVSEKIRSITSVLLAIGVLTLSVMFLAFPKKEFSENENRYLKALPELTWGHIVDGSYMEDLNGYLCDHFPFRDFFMGCKSRVEILSGRQEINQVFIAEDGYLIDVYQVPEHTEDTISILKNFADSMESAEVEMRLMLVPTSVYVYQEKLPDYAMTPDQMETARAIYEGSGIPKIDVSEALMAHKEDELPLYYHTDHHWTTYGAYIAYQEYCNEMGWESVPLDAWDAETVTESFCGTTYSRVNDYSYQGDAITIYSHPQDQLTVTYEDTGEVTDTLYNLAYLEQKDMYSLFLNNLHPVITISNENALTDRELVLIKDSYANSFVPFLAHHYSRIYVLDTRYYKLGPSTFLKEHPSVTDVLILYNMFTLDTDAGIRGIF